MASRWITVRKAFDFTWPSRAITAFSEQHLGEHLVKAELADFAVKNGYATEGKVDGSARSTKGTGAKRARRKGTAAGKTADSGSDDAVAQPSVADADRPADRQPVDPDAE